MVPFLCYYENVCAKFICWQMLPAGTEIHSEGNGMKKGKYGWLMAMLLALAVMALTGCAGRKKLTEYGAKYLDCFDTITSVTVCMESEEKFRELEPELHALLQEYHQLFDIYNNYDEMNNIKTINDNAGIQPVEVDREIINLLEFSRDVWKQTDGKVNVAMGSVLSIWHDYRTAGIQKPDLAQIPDLLRLEQADSHTDISLMEIDRTDSTVYLPDSAMQLDVGAVAKGYAVGKLCELLKERGITSAIVSAGGNVQTMGMRADGTPWRVGIQNPDTSSKNVYLHALRLTDMALVTSGSYQRFYMVDGVRYHHIINPDTLMPWNEYLAVTILCRDSAMADALSTAVFNMPLEQGKQLIESLEDTEAIWVMPDGEEITSSGFDAYVDDGYGI